MMTPATCPACCKLLVAPSDRTPPPELTEQPGDRERVLLRGVFVEHGQTRGHG